MKICFLGDANSVHLHKWINFFKGIGWEVYVISFKECKIEGVKTINLGENYSINSRGGNFQYLFKLNKIRNAIKNIKPDIVNAHYITSYGFIASLIKYKPLVLSAWGTDILVTPKKNIIYKLITKYALKKAALITSDSSNMSEEIVKLLDKKEKHIITVPMGVDIELFSKERSIHNDIINILSLRSLDENSNVEVIIKAFSKIYFKYPKAMLYIGNEGPLRQGLIELTKALNIEENVKFLGFISREELVRLFRESDYYISIPTSDATSVTLLEAMAAGVYPIVSDIPANKEWIEDGINGSVVGIRENEIAKVITDTYGNFQYINSVKEKNLNIIKEKASLQANMQCIAEAFRKLICK